jgi:hypothetical protein
MLKECEGPRCEVRFALSRYDVIPTPRPAESPNTRDRALHPTRYLPEARVTRISPESAFAEALWRHYGTLAF